MDKISEISVIIPTMSGREAMVNKLLSTLPEECEKIIVPDEDILLAAKRNKGARLSKGKYLFFVDDDNYLKNEFQLRKMLDDFKEEIGVMGMTACYDDKKMLVADGGSLRNYLTGFTRGLRTNCPAYGDCLNPYFPTDETARLTKQQTYAVDEVANAFMIRRDVFEESGRFDEVNFPIDLDEADLCKRIKDMGYIVVMNPGAVCYHRSQTYSSLPNFRRASNAYFLPRNKLFYQRKHLNALSYWVHVFVFLPLHICVYTTALIWRKKFSLILPYLKGTWDGLCGRRENKYQAR